MNTILETQQDIKSLIDKALAGAQTYQEYKDLVAMHIENNSNTGPEVSESLANYTMLTGRRMKRLDKTLSVPEVAQEALAKLDRPVTWLVLTESWCGDAAQSMPMMDKFAQHNANIDFKVVLRDSNLGLMDKFLTNGARSIPKLIALNKDKQVIGTWGPRPSKATAWVEEFKEKNGSLTPEFKTDLQVWYNKDKAQNIAEDLIELL